MVAAPELPLALSISFAPESSTISMTMYDQPEQDKPALPLEFKYKYDPSTPYAPIHEIVEDRNTRIKQHYWDLWNLGGKSGEQFTQLKVTDEFVDDGATISADEVESFCRVVGIEGEAYKKSYKHGMQIPLDFAIKMGWRSIMKPIFPPAIDGDLLKLVHLSNGFRVFDDAPALKVGDVVKTVSRIESITNSDTGKTVTVRGVLYLTSSADAKGKEASSDDQIPIIEVTSSFFYRGTFTDFSQTFSRVTQPTYSVPINTPQALAVLQAKEWFQWDDDSKPLEVGTTLQFKLESHYSFHDKSSYTMMNTTGGAYIITPELKLAVKVATIDYTSEGEGVVIGDACIEYLKRHGTALNQPNMLENGGYTLTKSGQCTFTTPASNLDYSLTSGDTNPIHTNPYFASLASLPGTITHGMHTSARTRKYVEQVVADNVGPRVRKYEVSFTAMCLPSRKMEVRLKHVGMTSNGDRLIKVETVDVEAGNVVLSGTAEVAQAPTAYVFTGQGSQEPGMGMELYNSSPVARAVWDEADRHLGEVYGFSILEIVRNNPKEKTVHFGGLKGQATRQKYMDMTYTSADAEGHVRTLPLFGDIDLRTSRYTFQSPTGLLYATQFAQIALVVTEKAAFEDMRAKGLFQKNCMFAGHSLGEYSALASIADILPISALVDVVFYRGITMQRAVERDHLNRSSYGMVAANPSRIGKTFGDAALREVVETISRRGNILIEVVNYNVEGQQYVVAGHLVALQSLTNVLNFLKVQKIDLVKLTETMSIEQVKEHLCEIVDECVQKARDLQAKTGFITLERGFATIPLPGIDVPFHSRYLWAGVMPFRTYLSKKVNPAHFNADLLVGRYIPNLTAVPYEVNKEYAERIHTQTSSPRLNKILSAWDEEQWGAPENRNKLGYAILIELLAYQFASPVRWIETQDILFKDFKFERLVELGPSPTLTGMASRTQKLKYDAHDSALGIKRAIYCIAKNQKEIYYQNDDVADDAPAPAAAAPSAPAPKAAAAPVAAAPPPPAPVAAAPAAAVADEPLKAVDTLRIIIAQKLKKPVAEVPLTKTIKELVGGKSTLQNEILGDLQGEFASAPEKGEEMPLAELGAALQQGYSGKLGKYTTGLVSRVVGSKMPGGFGLSAIQAHLGKTYGLGAGRIDGVLLFSVTQEPPKRVANEAEARAWVDQVASAYASMAGISLAAGGGAAAAAPAMAFAAPAAAGGGAPAAVPDAPLQAVDTLRAIIAQKLKKPIAEVPLNKSIKDLVGGKSTLQNEILGDLQGEFASAPEKGEEMPLSELGAALNQGYPGSLGKYTTGLVARMMGGKMPGGFGLSAAKAHLAKAHGLGPGRTDGALLVALTMEPEKRLGSEADAKAWLDSVASAYAAQAGISLGAAGGGGGGGAVGGGMMINTEQLDKLQEKQDNFVSQQVDLFLRYLGKDSREGHRLADLQKAEVASLQDKLDAISREHGDAYVRGIQPVFNPLKARHFNSSWNWVRQDALMMWMDILFGRLTTVDRDITARCLVIMNRADPALLDYMQYVIDNTPTERGETYVLAKAFGQTLLDNCREMVGQAPLYKDVTFPTAPKTTVTVKGEILSEEVNRPGVSRLEKYVAEMAAGSKVTVQSVNLDKVQDQVEKLYKLVKSQPQISKTHMQSIKSLYTEVVRGLGKDAPPPTTHKTGTRARRPSSQFLRPAAVQEATYLPEDKVPLLHLKRKIGNEWQYSSKLTSLYLDILKEIATSGVTFEHKNALMTGVGKGSIGIEIVKGLLAGGARVVVTTSRYSRSTVEYYQAIYQEVGAKGSSLTVVPFNQGSKQDVEALVDYIYNKEKGLGMDLDYILPFAALPENGREIDGIDDRSELAHRIMLTNVLRLLGAVKSKKAALKLTTRPTEVVLPLSPNHGLFGNDGLYSESKISLETLFNRWSSESWGEYLCIAGAIIGWTRGTGLMSATNTVAEGIEAHGCRTFSAKEMAFNILGLMHPLVFDVAQIEPVWADLNGGMDKLPDLATLTTDIRTKLNLTANNRRAVAKDHSLDYKVQHGPAMEQIHQQVKVAPRANFSLPFPELKPIDATSELAKLRGLIDLEQVVVLTGYAEVGPFGSSRTRWEMEANGTFSIQGTLELAYVMGLIKHFEGRLKDGTLYVGWVDAKTNEPLDDKDVKAAYEKHILAHTGIRLIEPEIFNGYDPKRKGFTQEIEIQHDLEPIEASEEDAARFKREHGVLVDVYTEDGSKFFVKFKKGAKLNIPKAVAFDRLVAGQIPTGWSHKAFGIPDDIASQVDRTSLWALVSVAEALMMAGITDPYELYKFVHPSEVGSSLGSGMGGITSISKMFRDRREEKDVQKDILQETFINTVAGWVNLLLLSSSGPIKVPVGACATALQSVEIACDTILSGKAKIMVAGGYDDFSEEGSYEFANMKATSNSETEFAAGREPNEMSRPTTSTRAGFMESMGCGAQVLMSAKTAIEMGATIYARPRVALAPRAKKRTMLRSKSLQQAPRLARRLATLSSYGRLLSTARSSAAASGQTKIDAVSLSLAVGAGAVAFAAYATIQAQAVVDMDAEPGKKSWSTEGGGGVGHYFHFKPHVFLWGRNSYGVTSPPSDSAPSTSSSAVPAPAQTVKRPAIAAPLSDLILRDLALSATYGVAVDANGDVLQWGAGFSPQGHVERTLTGRDIVKVAATQEGKVFGLSKRGQVYVWAADKASQDVDRERKAIEGFDWPRRNQDGEGAGWMMLLGKGLLWGRAGTGGNVETVRLGTDVQLERGEKFTSLSAGASHLLALTNKGRSFALPLCLAANEHGQLGVRSVTLLAPPHPGSSPTSGLAIRLEPDERLNEMGWEKVPAPPKKLDPLLLPAVTPPTPSQPIPHMDHIPPLPASASDSAAAAAAESAAIRLHPDPAHHAALERSIHFCTTLHEIPALRDVQVDELVAGKNHSLARLGGKMHGRVLGWGCNSYGQLGLGSALSYPAIPAPTEVPFRRSPAYQGSSRPNTLECVRIAAGGNVSYFVVEADDGKSVDLLASGQGQFGGLGNGLWAHATSPVRVKTVSGLREWNEATNKVESVGIKDIQAGEGHVAVVLDNAVKNRDGTNFGRDVFVWGYNEHYQLGTGKRSNLPTPQHLAPLPYPRLVGSPQAALPGTVPTSSKQEETMSSGTTSPMPHKRMQLSPAVPSAVTKLPRGAIVEEAICAGDGGTGVYWRVVNP